MKVSVIVPVYNVEKYIEKCLESLVNQTLKDIEIIIVDDGSPDNSYKIISKYLKKYQNILYLKKENGGLSSARNYGLKYAKGEYVSFVDSDDYVEKNMFEEMYNEAFEKKLDILSGGIKEINGNQIKVLKPSYNLSSDYKDYVMSYPMACGKLFKKDLFQKPFLFTEGIHYEDLELIPSLILKTKKIGYLDKPFYNYIIRDGSIMHQEKFNPKIHDIIFSLTSLEKRFKDYGEYNNYINEFEYLYVEHLLYSAPLQIANFKEGKECLNEFRKIIKDKFPNWKKNKYIKKKSKAFNLVINLSYLGLIKIIAILKKFK